MTRFAHAEPAAGPAPAGSAVPVPAPAGARIVSQQANHQPGGTVTFPPSAIDPAPVTLTGVPAYCQFDIVLTHGDAGDHVKVTVAVPETGWSGRMRAIGGSAYTAGDFGATLVGAVRSGYAAVTTDTGVPLTYLDTSWGLNADGTVNQPLLTDFASRSA